MYVRQQPAQVLCIDGALENEVQNIPHVDISPFKQLSKTVPHFVDYLAFYQLLFEVVPKSSQSDSYLAILNAKTSFHDIALNIPMMVSISLAFV